MSAVRLPIPRQTGEDHRRIVALSAIAVAVGLISAVAAELLVALINVITNLAFYQRLSLAPGLPWCLARTRQR